MIINGGIVTYNPDIEKLKKNISRIAGQVCKLVIADNGSKNIEDIKRLAAAFENVSVILNYENFGIARALNQIMKWSSNNGGDWTITLDQDSECSDCIIDLYKPYLNKEDVGMLTCRYTDRNLNEENVVYNSDCEEIDFCITSASLLKNECWKKTAGFDEYLFIDKVDNDICLKLQENGFKIICVNKVGFTHEVGKAKKISFLPIKRKYTGTIQGLIIILIIMLVLFSGSDNMYDSLFKLSNRNLNFTINIPSLIASGKVLFGIGYVDAGLFGSNKLPMATWYVDNSYLYVFLTMGIAGIAWFIVLLARLFLKIRKYDKAFGLNFTFTCVFVTYMFLGMSETCIFYPTFVSSFVYFVAFISCCFIKDNCDEST